MKYGDYKPSPDEWEVIPAPRGLPMDRWESHGYACLIRKGCGSLCAYIGLPHDHPLAGLGCGAEEAYETFEVHGGLTFSDWGTSDDVATGWRPGWYWYGWDYAHGGDLFTFYFDNECGPIMKNLEMFPERGECIWTVGMVKPEVEEAVANLVKKYGAIEIKK